MARTDNSAFTSVRQFLSAVSGYAVPYIRSADEFCAAFPPELIMDRIEDVEVRANILYATAGTRIEVARRTSKKSAGEQMKIALAEKLVAPEVVLELFSPDHRALYLDAPALWAFVVEKRFWAAQSGPSEAKAAKGMVALILEAALKVELVNPEEIVRAIGFLSFFEKESKHKMVDSFEAFTNAEPGKGFDFLLGRYTPLVMVETIALDLIWDRVVHPLIAVRSGLSLEAEPHVRSDELAESSSPQSTIAQVNASASSPSSSQGSSPLAQSASTGNSVKREATSPVTGSVTRSNIPAGTPVSSVPPASRISSGPQTGHESEYKDPKGDEASALGSADADDMIVGDDDIIESGVPSDSAKASNPTLPSASSPLIAQVPRPKSDKRLHPTGDANVEMVVELASLSDPDVRAALRDEPTLEYAGIPSTRSKTDKALSRGGGANRSDPPSSSRASMTPMSSKTAVYDLLRSADAGLKLTNVDPSTFGIRNLMLAALEEIDPSSYGGAEQRYGEANRLDLGNVLCSEIESRSTKVSARLRQILGEIGCATNPSPSQSPPSIRPPPLPSPKAAQSNPGSSEPRVTRVPQAEKKG